MKKINKFGVFQVIFAGLVVLTMASCNMDLYH